VGGPKLTDHGAAEISAWIVPETGRIHPRVSGQVPPTTDISATLGGMGLLDKVKGLLTGRKQQIKKGVDKVGDVIADKVPDKHAAKVQNAAEKVKSAVDKLPDDPPVASPATPPASPPVTPPVTPKDPSVGGTA